MADTATPTLEDERVVRVSVLTRILQRPEHRRVPRRGRRVRALLGHGERCQLGDGAGIGARGSNDGRLRRDRRRRRRAADDRRRVRPLGRRDDRQRRPDDRAPRRPRLDWNIWPAIVVVLLFAADDRLPQRLHWSSRPACRASSSRSATFFVLQGSISAPRSRSPGSVSIGNIDAAPGYESARKLFASLVWARARASASPSSGGSASRRSATWVLARTRFGNWIFGVGRRRERRTQRRRPRGADEDQRCS